MREQHPAECNPVAAGGQQPGERYVDIQPRVLVIDADTATLTSIASVAEEEGFDVRIAVDVDAAVRQCRCSDIDLVLIDAWRDRTSAADALSCIRTFKPSVRAVVVETPLGLDRLHRLFARLRCESYRTLPV
jgi:DNA-binding NtrC family response regulator